MENNLNVRFDLNCTEEHFANYETYCNAIALCIEKMDCLIPVFEKFDGKVINKRLNNALETAMQEAIPDKGPYGYSTSLKCDFELSRISIDVSLWGILHALNPSYRSINILHEYESYPTYDTKKRILYYAKDTSPFYYYMENGNNRLIAAKCIEYLEETKKQLQEKLEGLRKWTPEAYKEHILKMASLKKQVKDLEDKLPYIAKDLLNEDDLLRYI